MGCPAPNYSYVALSVVERLSSFQRMRGWVVLCSSQWQRYELFRLIVGARSVSTVLHGFDNEINEKYHFLLPKVLML